MSISNQVVVCDGGCGSVNKTPALVPEMPQIEEPEVLCPEESVFPTEPPENKEHDTIKPHVMDSVLGSEFYDAFVEAQANFINSFEAWKEEKNSESPDEASADSNEVGKKGELPQ